MNEISPFRRARIQAALDADDSKEAIQLLWPCFPDWCEPVQAITDMADGLLVNQPQQAEGHYRLAIALYDKCFPETHVPAMRALLQLTQLLESNNRQEELFALLKYTHPLVKRAALWALRDTATGVTVSQEA